MRKTPEEQADEAVALLRRLLETHSAAETGLMLTSALITLMRVMGVENQDALDVYGRAFTEMYLAEAEDAGIGNAQPCLFTENCELTTENCSLTTDNCSLTTENCPEEKPCIQ
jgi:hypothetical protein